jgi:hypothetical protein
VPTVRTHPEVYGTISEPIKVLVKLQLKRCSNKKRRFVVKARTKTSAFYKANPESAEKRREYQREYNKTEERKKYRAYLNKKNREAGTYGNGDKLDASHTKKGGIVFEAQGANRARNRSKK